MTHSVADETDGQAGDLSPPEASGRPQLGFDLDVEVCVVGGGLAGLTVARECARRGASVAVLEGRQVGWNASGCNLGTVMPGYGVPVSGLIERVGFENARELWSLSQDGVDYIRKTVADDAALQSTFSEGALEVSTVDAGDRLISRLQTLGEDFGADVEGWQAERVRDSLKTRRYFHAIHYPKAFQLDGRAYVHRLAAQAEQAGVRIFEDTPVVSIDPAGVRKRVVTPTARLRAGQVVLAGNAHIGAAGTRLAATLLPVWRYAALTMPLGERLAEAVTFAGSVIDSDGIDHFRIVDGDRLLWSSPETTWQADPAKFAKAIRQRIATMFPQLGPVAIADCRSGMFGLTVHGMPQIGQLRQGLWIVSGFGHQGLNTSAMAGELIARSMLDGDDRWKLFLPFELVWAGGTTGRVAGHVINRVTRQQAAAMGALARYRERAAAREQTRETAREARAAVVRSRTAAAARRAAAMREPRRPDGI
jgi:glycine/D-amino acid oxidase-like deaminating enzyme